MALSNVDNELFWASRNEDLNWNRDNHCGDVNFHQKVELKSYPFPHPPLITFKTLNLSAQTITMTMSQDYKENCLKHWGDLTVSRVFAVASSAISCLLFPQLKMKYWDIFSPKSVTEKYVLYIRMSICKTIFLMINANLFIMQNYGPSFLPVGCLCPPFFPVQLLNSSSRYLRT